MPATQTPAKPAAPAISEQDFLLALKQKIDLVYQDGIDRILNWDIDGDTIVGMFQDGAKAFNFTLSAEDGLDYGPSQKGVQQVMDSLMLDYPFLQDKPRGYAYSYLLSLRQDKAVQKKCTSPTAYSCGDSCINNKKRCRVKGASIASPQELRSLIEAGKKVKSGGGASQVKNNTPQIPPMAGALGKAGAIAAGAALLGVPVATYVAFRTNYRDGFKESANQAKMMAAGAEVPDLEKDKTNITFTVGGFAGDAKGGERIKAELEKADMGLGNHHIQEISNEGFDVRTAEEESLGIDRSEASGNGVGAEFPVRALRTFMRSAIQQGRNPVAVKVASQAYAYHQKYPDKPISLVGHSAGGITVREAAEILEQMGVKNVKTVAIGSPHFGLTEATQDNLTIATKQDPILQATGHSVMNGAWFDSVKGHQIKDYFGDDTVREFLKLHLNPAEPREDADPTQEQQQFIALLRQMLERSYTDGIDRFLSLDISKTGDISGVFRDGNKYVQFTWNASRTTTKLIKSPRRDSAQEERYARWDTPRRQIRERQCEIGLSCGGSCIESTKTCRIGTTNLARPGEVQKLKALAIKVRQPDGVSSPKDPLDELDIRSLKREAQKRGVNRYSYMTKEELKGAIRTVEQSPSQEERLRRTLERRKVEKEAIENTKPGAYAKTWNQLQKILKVAGVRPDLAIGAIGALLIGTSYKVYMDLRQHYRDGLKDSAEAAKARAEKMDVPRVRNSNITFTVGGFRGDGSTGGELKQRLEEADPWYKRSHTIIPFDSDDYDIPASNIPKRNPDGSYNPAYLGHVAVNGFGASFRNFYKQRNEGSVELAAQIYAQAMAVRKEGDKLVPIHEDKPIHILAHGAGGLTAREAMDILAEMPEGKKVLQRINLISMGTPDFGFTEPTVSREMTLSGTGDPWSILPTRKEKRVPSVKGHEIEDYLTNQDAIAQISRFLGKGRTSTYYEEERLRKEKAAARRENRRRKKSNQEPKGDQPKQDSAYELGRRQVLAASS